MAIITTPVTEPSQIQTALGLSGVTNYAVLMRPDLYGLGDIINKWSKNKPLDRPTIGILSDDSRKAYKASLGIYWGLQAGSATGDWANIHKATWAYVDRPTGDIDVSPFRPYDFVGYDPQAQPTLTGYSSEGATGKVNYNSGTPFGLELAWNRTGNTTGVDIFECTNLTGVNLETYYLFILIDGYCRAMINADAGNTVNPILHNGVEGRRFTCPALPDALKRDATRTVSFFLADINDVNADVRNTWVDTFGLHMGVQAISIPDAVAYSVQFMASTIDYGYMKATISLSYDSRMDVLSALINITEHASSEKEYKVYLEFGGATAVSKSFTGGTQTSFIPLITWTKQESGILWLPGQTLDYDISLYGSDANGNAVQLIDNTRGTITIPNA